MVASSRKGLIVGTGIVVATVVAGLLLMKKGKVSGAAPSGPAPSGPPPIPSAAPTLTRFNLVLLSHTTDLTTKTTTVDFEVQAFDQRGELLANVKYEIQINGISEYVSQTDHAGVGGFSLTLPASSGFTINVVAGAVISNAVSVLT